MDTVTVICPACLERFTGPEGNVELRTEAHTEACLWVPTQRQEVTPCGPGS